MKPVFGFILVLVIVLLIAGSFYALGGEFPADGRSSTEAGTTDTATPENGTEAVPRETPVPAMSEISFLNTGTMENITLIENYTHSYTAGDIITKDDGDLLLVTRYIPDRDCYCTRVISVDNGEYLYVSKDSSFMQLGTSCDPANSIDALYTVLYDDLNENTNDNTGDYRNSTRNDRRMYVKFDDAGNLKVEGYLVPETPESMKHIAV